MIGAIWCYCLLYLLYAPWVGRRAELAGHLFGAYVGYGIGFIVAAQAFINMAVSSGLLPTKGCMTLIRYGSSSLLVTGMMIGLLLRVTAGLGTAPGVRHYQHAEPRLS